MSWHESISVVVFLGLAVWVVWHFRGGGRWLTWPNTTIRLSGSDKKPGVFPTLRTTTDAECRAQCASKSRGECMGYTWVDTTVPAPWASECVLLSEKDLGSSSSYAQHSDEALGHSRTVLRRW